MGSQGSTAPKYKTGFFSGRSRPRLGPTLTKCGRKLTVFWRSTEENVRQLCVNLEWVWLIRTRWGLKYFHFLSNKNLPNATLSSIPMESSSTSSSYHPLDTDCDDGEVQVQREDHHDRNERRIHIPTTKGEKSSLFPRKTKRRYRIMKKSLIVSVLYLMRCFSLRESLNSYEPVPSIRLFIESRATIRSSANRKNKVYFHVHSSLCTLLRYVIMITLSLNDTNRNSQGC